MPNIVMTVISPSQLTASDDVGSYDLAMYEKKCLAQGDSWFSIGQIPPWATTNILAQMILSKSVCAVNCARPGEDLAHMTDTTYQVAFLNLLRGRLAYRWDGILLSGGGNDMIDALQVPPVHPPDQRLLLTPVEAGDAALGVARYISDLGWQAFILHMNQVFDNFLAERDSGINKDVPVFFHTYDYSTPRNAPAGLGFGPWLCKAMSMYGIPESDWIALANELNNRLGALLQGVVAMRPAMNLHLIQTLGTIGHAALDAHGVSGDWENEIHPTPHGYSLLAQKWRPVLDACL